MARFMPAGAVVYNLSPARFAPQRAILILPLTFIPISGNSETYKPAERSGISMFKFPGGTVKALFALTVSLR